MTLKEGPVYCSCCGNVVMAKVLDGKLVIIDKRNRQKHIVSLDLTDISKDVRLGML